MLPGSHRRWLVDELPGLVREGVLAPEAAERLRARYAEADGTSGRRLVVGLFGVLGALLVGGGLILMLAHNWEQLSRPARAAIALAPLVAALALAAWVVARGRGAAWGEAVAAAWVLAIGGAISLVAQTYHLPGEWTSFLRGWLLLGLPIVYLLGSVTAATLYALGLLAWVFSCAWGAGDPILFLPLLALVLPFVAGRLRGHPQAAGSELLAWACAVVLAAGLVPSVERLDSLVWAPLLASAGVGLWAGGWLTRSARWSRAPRLVGALAFGAAAFALSFVDLLGHLGRHTVAPGVRTVIEAVIVAAIALGAAALCVLVARSHRWRGRVAGGGLLVAWLALLVARVAPGAAAVLVNLSLLALGVALMARGMRQTSLAMANLGTAIVALLVLLRFFDTEVSFLLRGAAFVAIGLGFLALNVALWRRREAS